MKCRPICDKVQKSKNKEKYTQVLETVMQNFMQHTPSLSSMVTVESVA